MLKERLKKSAQKTLHTFFNLLPVITGMLLLTSLAVTLFPKKMSTEIFGAHAFVDVLLGAFVGSVAAGNPLTSYILGGELLAGGVSLFAVTALIVSWVTVGLVQMPAEMLILGKRFAIYRNVSCFLLAIAVSLLTVYTLKLIG
jgi:uncharacterized membrane protein YraQ (UPF0718 family)